MATNIIWVDSSAPLVKSSQEHGKKERRAPAFQFVQESGISRASKGLVEGLTIRSHAAKSREHNRRQSKNSKKSSQSPGSHQFQENMSVAFMENRRRHATLWEVEEFGSLKIAPKEKQLASLNIAEAAVIQSELLWAISLLGTATDTKQEKSIKNRAQLLRYRGNLLGMIQRQLQVLCEPYFESTVAAIACLAIFESLNGDVAASWVHVRGLENAVTVGENPRSLPPKNTLRRLVTWATLCHGALSQHIPTPLLLRIEGDEICQGFDRPDPEVVSTLQDCESDLKVITHSDILSREATTIFCYLRRLSKVCDAKPYQKSGNELIGAIETFEFLEHVENRTANLLLAVQEEAEDHFRLIMVSFCLAANIFIYAILRGIPLSVPYYSVFVTRLWCAVQQVEFTTLEATLVKSLLWIVFVGRLAAHGRPEQDRFEEKLKALSESCGLDGGDTMRLVFKQMLWPRGEREFGGWSLIVESMGILQN